ncbi:MAG: radical SAM protein [Desulfovibrio sp.]
MDYKYIFGPVLSGRIGLSLGIDLLGAEICSLDCVYCEVGATTELTMARKPYIPAATILKELAHWKNEGPGQTTQPEFITLGGMGEPTLNSDLAVIISGIRDLFPSTPVAVLTNATTFTDPVVRKELLNADVVLPSMDSLIEEDFRKVNRPCKELKAAEIRQGVLDFKAQFSGKLFLEILLVKDYNDSKENLSLLKDFCAELDPERVDIVTLSRPGTLASAKAVSPETMELWQSTLQTEKKKMTTARQVAIKDNTDSSGVASDMDDKISHSALGERIIASVSRRPQTIAQLALALGVDEEHINTVVAGLLARNAIRPVDSESSINGEIWFHAPAVRQ